jgi:uncharacterized caspase-like protein
METIVRRAILLVILLTVFCTGDCWADKRVALIVGNSRYQTIAPLNNPGNDATLMAETLRNAGFTLVGNGAQLDLDKPGFDRAVQDFGRQLAGADVALFYYSGHGVQVRGENYLVPVTANPTREADVDFQMLNVSLVLRQMEGSGTKLNIVILDACRNNPFGGRGLRGTEGGLAQIAGAEGTLISFATQPGKLAQDGGGSDSPFTSALAEVIRKPGLDVLQTFNQVGLKVMRSTGNEQVPWTSSSPIDGSFYFTAGSANQVAAIPPQPAPPPSQPPSQPAASAPRLASVQPSLDQLALDYVNEDMSRSQGSAAEYMDHVRRTLDDQIDYYGQLTSRADVIKDKEKYVARWPSRSYRVRTDSLRTTCDPAASRCQVAGLVDFSVSDPAKNRRTQGTSTFEYGVRFGPDGPKLFREQGKVLPAQH